MGNMGEGEGEAQASSLEFILGMNREYCSGMAGGLNRYTCSEHSRTMYFFKDFIREPVFI